MMDGDKTTVGGRFVQAFCIGAHSSLCFIAVLIHAPTFFLINGLLAGINVFFYTRPKE